MKEELILVRLNDALPHKEELFAALGPAQKQKGLRYRREEDQVRSALAALLVARYVGLGDPVISSRGKPSLPGGREYNLSHAGEFVGIYVADVPVGFDIEETSRCHLEIVKGAFTPQEAETINDPESFAVAWTRKEAVTKCLGTGIERPTEYGLVSRGKNKVSYLGELYFVHTFPLEGHVCSLAKHVSSPFPKAEFVTVTDLLG